MTAKSILSLALGLSFSLGLLQTANAQEVLTADQYNELRIKRKELVLLERNAERNLEANGKKMELYLAWTNPEIQSQPDEVKDKLIPSIMHVIGGVGATALLLQKNFPALINRLPKSVQVAIRASPAVVSFVLAAFKMYGYKEYQANVQELQAEVIYSQQLKLKLGTNDLGENDPLVRYYNDLVAESKYWTARIEVLSNQINDLNRRVSLYE